MSLFHSEDSVSSSVPFSTNDVEELLNEKPNLVIYKNSELEVLCQKVKILRQNWIKLWDKKSVALSSSPVITIKDVSHKLQDEIVKFFIHLNESQTCKIVKRINKSSFDNISKYQECLKQREHIYEIEVECSILKKPSDLIVFTIGKIQNNPKIMQYLLNINAPSLVSSNYILKFKDLEEYLLQEIPLYNYIQIHKCLIDYGIIYLELVPAKSQPFCLNFQDDFEREIYKIASNLINKENDLINNHEAVKLRLKMIVNILSIISEYNKYFNTVNGLFFSGNIDMRSDQIYQTLSLERTNPQFDEKFRKIVLELFSSLSNRFERIKLLSTLVDMLTENLLCFPSLMRNFSTKKFDTYSESISRIRKSKEPVTSSMINLIYFELYMMIKTYYTSMHCTFNDICAILPSKYLTPLLNRRSFSTIDAMGPFRNFRLTLHSLCNISPLILTKFNSIFIKIKIYYCSRFTGIKSTSQRVVKALFSQRITFDQEILFDLPIEKLLSEMALIFYFYAIEGSQEKQIYAGFLRLFDENISLVNGDLLVALIPIDLCKPLKILCRQMDLNKVSQSYPYIHLNIPIIMPFSSGSDSIIERDSHGRGQPTIPSTSKQLKIIIKSLNKFIITRNFKKIYPQIAKQIWPNRDIVKTISSDNSLIPLIVYCGIITYASDEEFETFFTTLPVLTIDDYLLMLGPMFSNHTVRKYSIKYMSLINAETVSTLAYFIPN
ncbi:hypothetical protein HZS_6258, partial [Henneguya salminicola]